MDELNAARARWAKDFQERTVACPTCTFENQWNAEVCDVCGAGLRAGLPQAGGAGRKRGPPTGPPEDEGELKRVAFVSLSEAAEVSKWRGARVPEEAIALVRQAEEVWPALTDYDDMRVFLKELRNRLPKHADGSLTLPFTRQQAYDWLPALRRLADLTQEPLFFWAYAGNLKEVKKHLFGKGRVGQAMAGERLDQVRYLWNREGSIFGYSQVRP
jgi:hypothetical protein